MHLMTSTKTRMITTDANPTPTITHSQKYLLRSSISILLKHRSQNKRKPLQNGNQTFPKSSRCGCCRPSEIRIGKKNIHHFPFLSGWTKSSSYFKMIVFENQMKLYEGKTLFPAATKWTEKTTNKTNTRVCLAILELRFNITLSLIWLFKCFFQRFNLTLSLIWLFHILMFLQATVSASHQTANSVTSSVFDKWDFVETDVKCWHGRIYFNLFFFL